jgi:hypothetical protein
MNGKWGNSLEKGMYLKNIKLHDTYCYPWDCMNNLSTARGGGREKDVHD